MSVNDVAPKPRMKSKGPALPPIDEELGKTRISFDSRLDDSDNISLKSCPVQAHRPSRTRRKERPNSASHRLCASRSNPSDVQLKDSIQRTGTEDNDHVDGRLTKDSLKRTINGKSKQKQSATSSINGEAHKPLNKTSSHAKKDKGISPNILEPCSVRRKRNHLRQDEKPKVSSDSQLSTNPTKSSLSSRCPVLQTKNGMTTPSKSCTGVRVRKGPTSFCATDSVKLTRSAHNAVQKAVFSSKERLTSHVQHQPSSPIQEKEVSCPKSKIFGGNDSKYTQTEMVIILREGDDSAQLDKIKDSKHNHFAATRKTERRARRKRNAERKEKALTRATGGEAPRQTPSPSKPAIPSPENCKDIQQVEVTDQEHPTEEKTTPTLTSVSSPTEAAQALPPNPAVAAPDPALTPAEATKSPLPSSTEAHQSLQPSPAIALQNQRLSSAESTQDPPAAPAEDTKGPHPSSTEANQSLQTSPASTVQNRPLSSAQVAEVPLPKPVVAPQGLPSTPLDVTKDPPPSSEEAKQSLQPSPVAAGQNQPLNPAEGAQGPPQNDAEYSAESDGRINPPSTPATTAKRRYVSPTEATHELPANSAVCPAPALKLVAASPAQPAPAVPRTSEACAGQDSKSTSKRKRPSSARNTTKDTRSRGVQVTLSQAPAVRQRAQRVTYSPSERSLASHGSGRRSSSRSAGRQRPLSALQHTRQFRQRMRTRQEHPLVRRARARAGSLSSGAPEGARRPALLEMVHRKTKGRSVSVVANYKLKKKGKFKVPNSMPAAIARFLQQLSRDKEAIRVINNMAVMATKK